MMNTTLFLKLSSTLLAGAILGFAVRDFSASPGATGAAASSPGERLVRSLEKALQERDPRTRARALRQAMDHHKEIPDALKSLNGRRHDRIIFNLELELLEAWVAQDPKAALAYADQLKPPHRGEAIYTVISAWLRHDRAVAQATIEALPPGDLRNFAEFSLVHFLSIHNPALAVEALQARRRSIPINFGMTSSTIFGAMFFTRDGWHTLFSTLAEKDPRQAIELALTLPEGSRRADAINSLVYAWGESDPKAAISFVKELPPNATRRQCLERLILTLAQREPQEAIELAMAELRGGAAKNHALVLAVGTWATKDLGAARGWVEQLPSGELRDQATTSLIQGWSKTDPKAAIHYLQDMPKSQVLDMQLGGTLARWINSDPKGGLQWLSENPGAATPAILSFAANGLAHQNPTQALELLTRIPPANREIRSYENIASQWVRSDPKAAEASLDRLPDGLARNSFLHGLISGMANDNPDGASKKVEALPPGSARNSAAISLAFTWAQSAPDEALEWAARATEGETQDTVIKSALDQWARNDLDAASDWLNTLLPGRARDTAITTYSETAARKDPESAAAWAVTIGDEGARRTTLNQVVQQWLRRDEKTARGWVQSASVPAEWKERWLKK